jgi:hypothetical protein
MRSLCRRHILRAYQLSQLGDVGVVHGILHPINVLAFTIYTSVSTISLRPKRTPTSRNNHFATIQRLRSRLVEMLKVSQRAFDTAEDTPHCTTCIVHVIALLVPALAFREVGLEADDFV